MLLSIYLLPRLTASFEPVVASVPTATPYVGEVTQAEVEEIEARLREVGLAEANYLASMGISAHIQRLQYNEISPEGLQTYADNLETLGTFTAQYGEPIPVTFWDVQTEDMRNNGYTEYDVAASMAMKESHTYLELLARSHNRLYDFKQVEDLATDTALDAAPDILQYTVEYYDQNTEEDFADFDEINRTGIAHAIVTVWQQVLVSPTRTNPLTGEPMFSHSIYAHFNVSSMWRYRVNQNLYVGEIWGVSGFDDRFIGVFATTTQSIWY